MKKSLKWIKKSVAGSRERKPLTKRQDGTGRAAVERRRHLETSSVFCCRACVTPSHLPNPSLIPPPPQPTGQSRRSPVPSRDPQPGCRCLLRILTSPSFYFLFSIVFWEFFWLPVNPDVFFPDISSM